MYTCACICVWVDSWVCTLTYKHTVYMHINTMNLFTPVYLTTCIYTQVCTCVHTNCI